MNNLSSLVILLQLVLQLLSNPETAQNPAVQNIVKNAIASATEVLSANQFNTAPVRVVIEKSQTEDYVKPTVMIPVPTVPPVIPEGSIDTNDPKNNPVVCQLKVSLYAMYDPANTGVSMNRDQVLNHGYKNGFKNLTILAKYSYRVTGAAEPTIKGKLRNNNESKEISGLSGEGEFSFYREMNDTSGTFSAEFGDTKCYAYFSDASFKEIGVSIDGKDPKIFFLESSVNPL